MYFDVFQTLSNRNIYGPVIQKIPSPLLLMYEKNQPVWLSKYYANLYELLHLTLNVPRGTLQEIFCIDQAFKSKKYKMKIKH